MRTKRKQKNVARSDGPKRVKKHKRKLRKQAAAQQLSRLRHNLGWCHWCGVAIVRVKMMQRLVLQGKVRLVKTDERGHQEYAYHIPLANDAGAFLARIATTDHVTPLSENGGNKQNNLVDACKECNCRRGVENQHK